MALKVVVWGTGNVGRPAIRAVAAHRGLELVGVIAVSYTHLTLPTSDLV